MLYQEDTLAGKETLQPYRRVYGGVSEAPQRLIHRFGATSRVLRSEQVVV